MERRCGSNVERRSRIMLPGALRRNARPCLTARLPGAALNGPARPAGINAWNAAVLTEYW